MQGQDLTVALGRTSQQVRFIGKDGEKLLLTPSEAKARVQGSQLFVGEGTMHRVKSIVYRLPPPKKWPMSDSGFNLARYPSPDPGERTFATKFPALARMGAGL